MSRIVDLEASALELIRFKGHLMMCEHCTRYYKQFLALKAALGEVKQEDLPQDFAQIMEPILNAAELDDT